MASTTAIIRMTALAAAALSMAGAALAADITLYENDEFAGRRFEADGPVADFARMGFADTASSLVINRGSWQICSEAQFRGRCVVLGPGRYGSLRQQDLNDRVASLRPAGMETAAAAGIVFYEHNDFGGRSVPANAAEPSLRRFDMNDMVSSIVVRKGNWQVCADDDYKGRCVVLAPGHYTALSEMNLNDAISSARPVFDQRPDYGADISFFEHDNFAGQRIDNADDVPDFGAAGMNDKISSIIIERGQWQVCVDAGYSGRCVALGPGRYPSMSKFQLNDAISSARRTTKSTIPGDPRVR